MITITAIVVLAMSFGISLFFSQDNAKSAEFISKNDCALIDVSNPKDCHYVSYFGNEDLDDASFASMYSIEQNARYRKEVTTDGDFTFTTFKRIAASDSFHPDFLCFVSYNGNNRNFIAYTTTSFFSTTSNNELAGGSYGGSEILDCILVIGRMDKDSSFLLRLELLNEQAEEQYMKDIAKMDNGNEPKVSDYALSEAELKILID